jgi:uncharacterized protein GlcG (DUF336 family)
VFWGENNSGGKRMEKTFAKHTVTAVLAAKMIEAAASKADSLGVSQVIAILDESGLLKAFYRMDGAPLISIEVAQNKAYTALLGAPSQDFFNRIKDNPALLAGVPHIPRIAVFGGGLPIKVNGTMVGGIGVSGGSVDQDIECAQAGLDAIAGA